MTRTERRWCVVYALLLMVVTTVPIWLAFRSASPEWRFSGFLLAVEDGNSYIAKMNLGASGAWLFRSPYTAMPQRGTLAFLPYLLLGKLAAPPELHLQLVLLFQLFRLTAIPVLVLAVYRLAALVSTEPRTRRWATVLATAGGGLGWVLALAGSGQWLGSLPLDFISPESFGFLALLTLPHLILARALVLWALVDYLQPAGSGLQRFRGGLLLAAAALVQPLATLAVFALVPAHQLLLWLRAGRPALRSWLSASAPAAARLLLPSVPPLLYFATGSLIDPYLRIWAAQNQLPSPHPLHYLLAYGLALPFAALAAWRAWRANQPAGLLLTAWIVLLPLLAYLPYPVQRRLPEGVWVALSLLAMQGLGQLRHGHPRRAWYQPALAGVSLLSSLALLAGAVGVARNPGRPAFITGADEAAFAWLAEHASPGEVVLAARETGNALPAWAPLRVIAGLGPESAGQEQLLPQIDSFYDGGMDVADQAAFLESQVIEWVVYGPLEAGQGPSNPTWLGLALEYDRSGYRIFRVGGGS